MNQIQIATKVQMPSLQMFEIILCHLLALQSPRLTVSFLKSGIFQTLDN